jgi:hypothetical protein
VNGCVYVLGGQNKHYQYVSQVYRLSPNHTLSSTLGARCVQVNATPSQFYHSGNNNKNMAKKKKRRSCWKKAFQLKTDRAYFGACAIGTRIYVAGGNQTIGRDRDEPFALPPNECLEVYESEPGKESFIESVSLPVGMTFVHHQLTAVGLWLILTGPYHCTWACRAPSSNPSDETDNAMFSDVRHSNVIHLNDTGRSKTKYQWISFPDMLYCRLNATALSFADRYLIVLGGDDSQAGKQGEWLDVEHLERGWQSLPCFHYPRMFLGGLLLIP